MNDDATLVLLPIWKKDSSAADFFAECSLLARKHPERFGRAVLAYEEKKANGNTMLRTARSGSTTTNEAIGILVLAQHDIIDAAQK